MVYGNVKIKQYSQVTYLGCIFDETVSGESMVLHVLNKSTLDLDFFIAKTDF